MATAGRREATPPPIIGKAGRYTVFITPPSAAARPSEPPRPRPGPSPRPANVAPLPARAPPSSPAPAPAMPPPVQVPPQRLEKAAPAAAGARGAGSVFGFFWDAVAKVQDVHSSLDEYLADWFGLNQSKYQWALNDYYESKVADKEGGKLKELKSKGQVV